MRASDNRVHITDLKSMSETAAHYRYQSQVGRADTNSLSLGRLVHYMALEDGQPHVFDGTRRGKAYEAWAATLPPDAVQATQGDYDTARNIVDALQSDPLAVEWLSGQRELDIEWEWCGLPCSSRLDVYHPGVQRLVDLKTTAGSAGPYAFARECKKYSYHAQMAFYREALRWKGLEVKEVGFVAVSTKPPHVPAVYRLTDEELELGERMCRAWIEALSNCLHSGHWPGYSAQPMELGLAPSGDW